MKWLDLTAENASRAVARRSSRRSLLGSLGALLVGGAALPLLPVARGAQPPASGEPKGAQGDPANCQYWRHCAIDGFLCSCCGGTQSTCPPGTEMSAVSWIGTCHNPADGKDYAISYNDCCGAGGCGRCLCTRNERDTPMFQPSRANDYNWCAASSAANIPYHCSTARIVGAVGS
jgi:methylamine dehydrogenase light chain